MPYLDGIVTGGDDRDIVSGARPQNNRGNRQRLDLVDSAVPRVEQLRRLLTERKLGSLRDDLITGLRCWVPCIF